jgi:hypothetical protein
MKKFDSVVDSGKREEFKTGAVRDINEGKPRFDLIPPLALLRIANHYANGARKYNEWNWSKGMKFSRFYESALRHLVEYALGYENEDHLSAVIFNLMSIIHFQELERKDLNDMPVWKK